MLFGHFGIDDLRLLPLRLAILLGHVGHDFARVGSCPDRILDAIRGVGQNLELFISGAAGASGAAAARPTATSNIAHLMASYPMHARSFAMGANEPTRTGHHTC